MLLTGQERFSQSEDSAVNVFSRKWVRCAVLISRILIKKQRPDNSRKLAWWKKSTEKKKFWATFMQLLNLNDFSKSLSPSGGDSLEYQPAPYIFPTSIIYTRNNLFASYYALIRFNKWLLLSYLSIYKFFSHFWIFLTQLINPESSVSHQAEGNFVWEQKEDDQLEHWTQVLEIDGKWQQPGVERPQEFFLIKQFDDSGRTRQSFSLWSSEPM